MTPKRYQDLVLWAWPQVNFNNNNNNNNLIIYIALFTCADQKRFTVISLKTIKVYIIIHKQLKPKR